MRTMYTCVYKYIYTYIYIHTYTCIYYTQKVTNAYYIRICVESMNIDHSMNLSLAMDRKT